tara:strand:- start:17908 stop:19320 length:1413 start_codon:yes stop_codon:yes gene_type:complete
MKITRQLLFKTLFTVITLSGMTMSSVYADDSGADNSLANTLPNIVVFYSDDHSASDMGAYGNKEVNTPVMDQLALEGMRFTNVFSSVSVCAPSRTSMYTGLYPQKNGMHKNHSQARADVKSMPHYLSALGYEVVLAGKVHVKPEIAFPFKYIKRHEIPNYLKIVGDKPFALIIAYNMPHSPFVPIKKGYSPDKVTLKPSLPNVPMAKRMTAAYYDLITNLDHEIGSHQFWLQKYGLLHDMLQIYVSDHGYGFPNSKWSLYDEGLKVPMIVKWPGKVKAGTVNDGLISLVDFLPTLVEVAGGSPHPSLDGQSFLPLLVEQKATGQETELNEHIFATYTNLGVKGANRYPMRAVRTKKFKLIVNLAHQNKYLIEALTNKDEREGIHPHHVLAEWHELAKVDASAKVALERIYHRPYIELYNIESDPFEKNNVADKPENQAEIKRLYGLLSNWMIAQKDVELSALKKGYAAEL